MSCGGFELIAVSKAYAGKDALRNVSVSFQPGEHTAVLGPSGSGKSTLLRILAGLEAPSAGRVLLNGAVASDVRSVLIPPHERSVAMVFQDLALWANLSALQNVVLGLAGTRLARHQARTRATEALALCGVESLADRKPGQLSGGEQQRVALARALAVRPSFLLLDEPFSSLDLMAKDILLAEIAQLAQRHECSLLVVSHDPFDVVRLCTSVVVIEDGSVNAAGNLGDILRTSRSALLTTVRARLEVFSPKHGDAGAAPAHAE